MAHGTRGSRLRMQSTVGALLPPALSLPLRARFGQSRERELSILEDFVRSGDVVVDIGAHQGVYTHHLARLVGRRGAVVAYEPQPGLVRYLRAASRFGPLRRMDLRERALSDTTGEAVLSVPRRDGTAIEGQATLRQDVHGPVETYRVPIGLLDDEVLPGPVRFVKIDVEGHELALLQGGRTLIERDRPVLLIEVEHRHAGNNVAAVASLLLDELGYEAFELGAGGALVAVPRALWDQGAALNERPGGARANNFVFRPGAD